MDQLIARLHELATAHSDSNERDFEGLLGGLNAALDDFTPAYTYRGMPSWDPAWIDLNEDGARVFLERGHTVERLLTGTTWQPVTEIREEKP